MGSIHVIIILNFNEDFRNTHGVPFAYFNFFMLKKAIFIVFDITQKKTYNVITKNNFLEKKMHRLIDIGHSRGVRIPKNIIQQAKLEHCSFEFQVVSKGLLIKPSQQKKRQGWAEAFKKAALLNSEEVNDFNNQFDDEDWVWEEKD
jgi:antitoxin MazE